MDSHFDVIRSHSAVMFQSISGRRDFNLFVNFEFSDFNCNCEALDVKAALVGVAHQKYIKAYCYYICV